MLTAIKEKATGIFAWIIVTLITIPFALWGINSYFEGGGEAVVASAEGVDIDLYAYQNALAERRRVLTQIGRDDLDADYFDSREFKMQVLDGLIYDLAESSSAEELGFRVGAERLGDSIRSMAYFQTDGAFDARRYQDLVRNAGISVAQFEQQQRRQLVTEQIRSIFTETAIVTGHDVDRAIMLLEQTRAADYAILSAAELESTPAVTDDEIENEYRENRDAYFAPEQVMVEYLRISLAALAEAVVLDEREALDVYEEEKARFRAPETRRVSHVLVDLAEDAPEEAVREALSKAESIAERARKGEDFAELAKAESSDAGSASVGGDLGVIVRGAMVKPFEDAAYALTEAGQIGDPVRSRFGYHVVKLTELTPESVKPFEEVQAEIEAELRLRHAEEQYVEQVERLGSLVYEEPESLVPAADELQLEVMRSDWFSREQGPGIAAERRVRTVAFGEEVLLEGLNSEAFELDGNVTVALRRIDHKERALRSLAEVSDEIRASLEARARADALAARGEEIIARLTGGAAWDEVVEAAGLAAVAFDGGRAAAADAREREWVRELFALPDATELPHFDGMRLSDGDYLVYRLNEMVDGDPQTVDAARREQVRALIENRRSVGLYLGYRERLRARSDVQIYEDQL